MRKNIYTLAALALCSFTASASTLYYAGPDGDNTGSAKNWWENANNWRVDSIDGTVSSSKPVTGDTAYISGVSNVVIGNNGGSNTIYGVNIDIAEGSVLTVTKNDMKMWGSTITIGSEYGLVFTNNIWGDYKNGDDSTGAHSPLTLNLGENGSVKVNGNFNSAGSAHINFTGMLDILEAGTFSIETRELVAVGGDVDFGAMSNMTAAFTAGDVATKWTQSADLVASAENVGNYKLFTESNKLYVQYVTGSENIPEPATASLSLLGLAALMMRRRRA